MDCGLRPGWEAALAPALEQLEPYIDKGALAGIFLGDEPMLAGISASNITAVADFIRARVGPMPKIYWNDGCRPFYDGHVEPCVHKPGHNPRSCWTNTSKVPASVDWVSCDQYEDPTKATAPHPWLSSAANPEAKAQRYFADHFIKSKPHDHQRIVLVPGIFGNRSDEWTNNYLADKLQGYWEWAQEDAKVAGFNPWHFEDRTWYAGVQGRAAGHVRAQVDRVRPDAVLLQVRRSLVPKGAQLGAAYRAHHPQCLVATHASGSQIVIFREMSLLFWHGS